MVKHGITILVGDGVKQPKESRKMPGVKKIYQESENSSKLEELNSTNSHLLHILTKAKMSYVAYTKPSQY